MAEKIRSEKYQKIIEAAIRVFSSKGFYNAKVSDIAREADVADGTIYLYFKNKDDILISIFEESIEHFIRSAKNEIALISDPIEKLCKFIHLHLSVVEEDPDRAQVLQIELRQSSKFMTEYAANPFKEYLGLISKIIEEGKDQGVFRKNIDPQIVKRAIFGAVDEMALEWLLLKRKKFSLKEGANQLCQMLVGGLKI